MFTIIYLSLILIGEAFGARQNIFIYNNQDKAKSTYTVIYKQAEPEICSTSFKENSGYATCGYGIWLRYTEKNFEGDHEFFVPRYQNCFEFTDSFNFSSIRPVGDLDDFNRPSVTFYVGETFRGVEEMFTSDTTNLFNNNGIRSLILNGPKQITLYTEVNFGGRGVCVEAQGHWGLITSVWSLQKITMFQLGPMEIKSFRFGCHV